MGSVNSKKIANIFYCILTELITDKDKERLQNVMAYGKDEPELLRKTKTSKAPLPSEEPKIDRFDEGT